jgi:hypothetical protein
MLSSIALKIETIVSEFDLELRFCLDLPGSKWRKEYKAFD